MELVTLSVVTMGLETPAVAMESRLTACNTSGGAGHYTQNTHVSFNWPEKGKGAHQISNYFNQMP